MRQRKTRCFLLLSITLAFCSLVTAKTPSKSTTSWQFFMTSNYARIQPAEQKNTYKLSIPRLAIQSLVAYSGAKKEKVIPITPVILESLFQSTNFKTDEPNAIIGLNTKAGIFIIKHMRVTPDQVIFTLKNSANQPLPAATGKLVGKLMLVIDSDAITTACKNQTAIGATTCKGLVGGGIAVGGAAIIGGGVYGIYTGVTPSSAITPSSGFDSSSAITPSSGFDSSTGKFSPESVTGGEGGSTEPDLMTGNDGTNFTSGSDFTEGKLNWANTESPSVNPEGTTSLETRGVRFLDQEQEMPYDSPYGSTGVKGSGLANEDPLTCIRIM